VRGAPAIGCAAAFGIALEAARTKGFGDEQRRMALTKAFQVLAESRPTAINLFWALERMQRAVDAHRNSGPFAGVSLAAKLARLAVAIHAEDIRINRAMGKHGAALIVAAAKANQRGGRGELQARGTSRTSRASSARSATSLRTARIAHQARVLTHCNAGALATADYGTALGVIRAARSSISNVWVDETRPFLQGARLTAWELMQDNIPVTLITDNMAAHFMQRGEVDAIVVGTDRVAANGDVANKIGTYGLAVLAHAHGVPFYVACPLSTIDLRTAHGKDIPIEQRGSAEVTGHAGKTWAPRNVRTANPAFDVTPARLVTALITERGVVHQPNAKKIRALMRDAA
jgi:methylthioribose-1-phosphate isomerase